MMFSRNVYFVGKHHSGTGYIRGVQIPAYLQEMGYKNVFSLNLTNRLKSGIKNSLIILIKYVQNISVPNYIRNNNVLVLDCVDRHDIGTINKAGIYGAMVSSEKYIREFGNQSSKPLFCIPHHWDRRIGDVHHTAIGFTIAYIGDPKGCWMLDQLPYESISVTSPYNTKWFKLAPQYSFHLNVRPPERKFKYKPFMKGLTAAAYGACIVTDRDWSSTEYLPDDYPYFIKEKSLDGIHEAIAHARTTYRTDTHIYAIECMRKLREKYSISRVALQYEEMIQKVLEDVF